GCRGRCLVKGLEAIPDASSSAHIYADSMRRSQSHDRPHPPEPPKAAHRGHAGSKIAACSRIGPHSGAFWSGGSRLESSQASYWLHWSMSRTPESSTSSSSCRSAGCCCFQPHGQQTDG